MTRADKFRGGLMRVFFPVCLLLFGAMLLCGIFGCQSPLAFTIFFSVFFAICAAALVFVSIRFGEKLTNGKFALLTCAIFLLLIVLQLLAAKALAVKPDWDFGGVYVSALEYLRLGRVVTHEHYFERFSNNSGLIVLEIIYFSIVKQLGFTPGIGWGIFLNIALIDAGILFGVLFCRKIWGNARAAIVLVISLCFLPNILYSPVFYTDSMSMPFVTLPLYLFACCLKQKRLPLRILLWASIGFLISFGTKLKGSVAVLLVAFLLYAAFNFGIKRIALVFLSLLIPFSGFFLLFDRQVKAMGIIKPQNLQTFKFPTEYWIYMGLNNPGGFSNDDFQYIYTIGDFDAKQQAARDGIVQRVKDYGVPGLLDHFRQKAAYTFGDGSLFIGNQLSRSPLTQGRMRQIFSQHGEYNKYFRSVADGYYYVILLLLLAGMVLRLRRNKFDISALLYVTLFGLSLFLMIWETRSRYLMNFSPLFFILAADSLHDLASLISKRFKKNKEVQPNESNVHSAQLISCGAGALLPALRLLRRGASENRSRKAALCLCKPQSRRPFLSCRISACRAKPKGVLSAIQ